MSDQPNKSGSPFKLFLAAIGVFVFFGFLTLILSGFAGNESPEERRFQGVFSEETIEMRWANLEAVATAQIEAFDDEKVKAAMAELANSKAVAPSKTEIVVPGSPTFLKQSEAAAPVEVPAPAEGEAKPAAPEAPTTPPAEPAPAESSPDAPKPEQPQAPRPGEGGEKAKEAGPKEAAPKEAPKEQAKPEGQ